MKRSCWLFPVAILLVGSSLLAWQRHRLQEVRTRFATLETRATRITTIMMDSPSGSDPATESGPQTPEEPPGAGLSLASITAGLEDRFDLSGGGEDLLRTDIIERVAGLDLPQARALFARVTAIIARIPEDQLQLGRSTDPEQTRAMLLLVPLIGRLQREAPLDPLTWMAAPQLPAFLRQTAGRFAAEAMKQFAGQDPNAALTWLESHAASLPEGDKAWPAALAAIAETDPARALREAGTRGIVRETTAAMVPALTTVESRALWTQAVLAFDDPERRSRRWTALVEEQTRTSGWAATFDIVDHELPPEARTPQNLTKIAEASLRENPADFAAKLKSLAPATTAELMPAFIAQWTQRDYNGAATWLRQVPADAPWRDAAVARFVTTITSIDPDAAGTWAATINDAALRDRVTPR
jgi:hypothetical protein